MNDDILIIGAGGFVGTALSRRLLHEGRSIHRLLSAPAETLGPRDRVHVGRLGDVDMLRDVLAGCGTVFHLASSTTPGSSAQQPALEGELNLQPSLRLIEVLQHLPDIHLVYVSSGGTLYGNPATATVAESAPLAPLSHHGAGKLAIETFLHTLHRLTGQRITVLRPSNLYGPGQRLRAGFGLIRTMLEHARQGSTMPVWGDGEAVRDLLYIDDMIEACIKVLVPPASGLETYNVGAGEGLSINQARLLVETVVGRPLQVSHQPARPGDVRRIVLDCAKLHLARDWRPTMPLKAGILHTWHWLESEPQ